MGSQDESSLAARRARLRGSLAKQALPPDPYSQDPYARAKTPEDTGSTDTSTKTEETPASQHETSGSNGTNGTSADPQHGQPGFRLEDLGGTTQTNEESASPPPSPASSPSGFSSLGSLGLGSLSESLKSLSRNTPNPSTSSGSSALTEIADWSTAEPEPPAVAASHDDVQQEHSELNHEQVAEPLQDQVPDVSGFFEAEIRQSQNDAEMKAEINAEAHQEPHSQHVDDPYAESGSAVEQSDQDFFTTPNPPTIESYDDDSATPPIDEHADDVTFEASPSPIDEAAPEPVAPVKESKGKKGSKAARAAASIETASNDEDESSPAPRTVTASESPVILNMAPNGQMHVIVDQVTEPTRVLVDQPAHVIIDKIGHSQVLDTLTNMDQAMGACAMNLSALQSTANLQTEALRTLSETLQNQTFSELGMGLTGLMDSLSAALEPMKAVSELVPAIDQLVQVMEAKIKAEPAAEEKLSPDQLVMNLADQLSAGSIDPWTFKSAYMAVFPDDHPADLLHRLVDLLGTSRLSGNLFRAAYDAVQAPDPPKKVPVTYAEDGNTIVKVVQDEALMQQLEELRNHQNEMEKKMGSRESEFNEMLAAKDQEIQDAQDLLNSRWEEFNQRYDELSESLQKRDEMIQEKESELARKDNENGRLRSQMDELKEMVSELQKQFSASKARAEALSKPGFFDSAPAAGAAPSLFDAAPAKPLFQGDPSQQQPQPGQQQVVQQQQAPQLPPQPMPAPPPQPQPQQAMMQPPPQPVLTSQQSDMQSGMGSAPPSMAPQPSSQAIPRQNQMTTPFAGAGPGSYGSGVRAQVFEVIVRQALAGAPWREICAGPMQVNNISPDEVEAEVKRRQALLKK